MHYGILGTTTAHHDDGTPVPLGGARLRALLAALALRQGRPVPADLLVDEVWDTEPPQDSSAALQTLVGRLRRTIGRDRVGSGPAGYWLTDPRTDLGEFQRLAADGRQALEQADHARAAEQLRAALALWRGPALADLPDPGGPATRLEAQREEARRYRITADLGLGRAADLTAELVGLCADRPLDEPLQYLLIRSLHESGRTAEALRRYEQTRRALADELGVDPGRQLQALHAELLAPTVPPAVVPPRAVPPAPAPAATPTEPAHPAEPSQPSEPAHPAGSVPAPPAPAAPEPAAAPRAAGNLRGRLTSFVGREAELTALRATLTASRLVTLTGPGGSGKTRLSVEAGRAEQGAGRWPDGVWLAELAPLESPEAVPGAVVSALGLRETVLHTGGMVAEVIESRSEDPVRRLVEHCGRRRMLLVLDNCEHLIQAAADLADRLLAECPGLTVLATSREPLGVPGETVLPVEPLPDPVALRLLAERAAAARPGFDPRSEPEACAEICHRLDGLPLAIELAAARLRVMTARQIADRLDSRFALLTAGSRTLLPRQQTLRAVVDWSWDLLGKRERAVLRRLSVFAGGWTLEDAEAVCSDDAEVPREEVADLLLSLVDKSLVVADLAGDGPPRYRMLETIHEYAAERLAGSTEEEATELRHLRHFRELVRTAELQVHSREQLRWLAVLEREQDNVRAALRRAVERRDEQEGLVLVLASSWFWTLRAYSGEARSWYEAVAALGPDPFEEGAPPAEPVPRDVLEYRLPLPPPVLAEARRQVRLYRLMSMFEANLDVLGDGRVTALALRILDVYTPGLPQSYRFPGLLRVFAAFLAGRLEEMGAMMDEVVEGCRRYGRERDLAMILQIRARMMNDQPGGTESADRDSEESLELFSRAGDLWGISQALAARGEALVGMERTEEAVAAYRRAIELAGELGAPQEVPMLQVQLGHALLASDMAEGERLVRAALDALDPGNQAANGAQLYGHLILAGLHSARGEYPQALAELDVLDRAQGNFGPLVPGVMAAIVLTSRALVTARGEDVDAGLERLTEGWRMLRALDGEAAMFARQMAVLVVPMAVGVLQCLAERDGDVERARHAALLQSAHQGMSGPKGGHLDVLEREQSAVGLLRVLGEEGYADALEQGRDLGLEEVTALLDRILGGPGDPGGLGGPGDSGGADGTGGTGPDRD